MDYQALKTELDAGHPVTGAYNVDNALAADELNAVNRTLPVESVSGSEILNNTDDTEFSALTDAQQNKWLSLCGTEAIDVTSGVAKSLEADLFGAGTTTRTNLLALKTEDVSRAVELGLGFIKTGDVQFARSL